MSGTPPLRTPLLAPKGGNEVITPANEAKLAVAFDHALRVKFDYPNHGNGLTTTRRLDVLEYFPGDAVEGNSYDEHGRLEGWRRFSLDKIVGDVIVR